MMNDDDDDDDESSIFKLQISNKWKWYVKKQKPHGELLWRKTCRLLQRRFILLPVFQKLVHGGSVFNINHSTQVRLTPCVHMDVLNYWW